MYFWSLNPNLCLVFTRNPSFCLKTTFSIRKIQWKIEKFHPHNLTSFFISVTNDFTQLKAKKFVKLKSDENVNFDFRIFDDNKIAFLGKMRHF